MTNSVARLKARMHEIMDPADVHISDRKLTKIAIDILDNTENDEQADERLEREMIPLRGAIMELNRELDFDSMPSLMQDIEDRLDKHAPLEQLAALSRAFDNVLAIFGGSSYVEIDRAAERHIVAIQARMIRQWGVLRAADDEIKAQEADP